MHNPFAGFRFARIAAERDIVDEGDSHTLELKHDGTGATNIIQRVINNETLPSELVEQSLLAELNKGTADINATKRDAAIAAGGSWITEGREIKNYVPPEVAKDDLAKPIVDAGGGSSSPVALHFCRMPSGLALAQHHSLPGPWQ